MVSYALLLCLVVSQIAADGCSEDGECPKDQACGDHTCEDPCKDGCGVANTVCKVNNHRPFCFCLPGHYGSPTTGCASGCSEDKDCPLEQSCVNHNCEDPCKNGCGLPNTVCNVTNHQRFCSCPPGYYGSPSSGCITGCNEDIECPKDQACLNHKCENPCKDGCGVPNTLCNVTNHRPFCSCLPGHHGGPTTGCTAGCSEDGECPNEEACVNHKCADPCKDGCGLPNTVCNVTNHRPFCSYVTHTVSQGECSEDGTCSTDKACINHKCQDPCKDGCGIPNTICNVTNHRSFCFHLPDHDDDTDTGCKGKYTSQCKTTLTSGYDYNQFFPLSPIKDHRGLTDRFILRFKVKTGNDAHVLLTTKPFPSGHDPVIEIVIGGWSNTRSVIRPRKQGAPIPGANKHTMNILSENEMKGFWVRKNHHDQLAVGIEDSSQPIMQGTDPHHLHYQFFSFSSWDSASATWLYDCTFNHTDCTSNPN